ncbi:MAG: hypothetical protein WBA74_15700 [Cyclobacteriaceae bacterium]
MTKEHEIKNIVPGEGLGIIKFGMTKDQLKLILGNADETETDYTDGIEDEDIETWHYDELDLSVQFSESTNYRLISIATGADYAEFEGATLIGKDRDFLVDHLEKAGVEDILEEEIEDESGEKVKILVSDELGLNFWMEDGAVSEIQWIPMLEDDEENICWPD